jgi:DNA-binding transcriptional ArsR family regulator
MKDGPDIARLAALIGDPARASILTALMAGRALTAGECAREAGITASTASGHLMQLVGARLLIVEVQGRHRYYRIADADVAEAIEALMGLAARVGLSRTRTGPREPALRRARLCYDHLAGAVAVKLYARLIENGLVAAAINGLTLTSRGRARFAAERIDLSSLEARSRPLCRACLDWSERRPHLAGSLGAAIAGVAIQRGWCRKDQNSRALTFRPGGEEALLAITDVGCGDAAFAN